ncbi:MAG: hypothetical protein M3Q07_07240 [Pseudobdellovibrionaceae bacterium]|nr:hypothetical protein [Pseudobdellovibrionaceae bacterium]
MTEYDPQVIFYLGPRSPEKTRHALRTIPASPRSLLVTLEEDPYTIRSCHWHDFDCNCLDSITPLYGPKHVRIAGSRNWKAEIFGEQRYDRLFFMDLPDFFRQEDTALDLAKSLARLAIERSADVMAQLHFPRVEAVTDWEQTLNFSWRGYDKTIGFWMNTLEAPIRYLRLSARELTRPSLAYSGNANQQASLMNRSLLRATIGSRFVLNPPQID